jgi:hypothetical protein
MLVFGGVNATEMDRPRHVRSAPDSDQTADIAGGRFRARSGHQSAETFGGPADVSAGAGPGSPTEDDADKPRDW